MSCPKYSKRHYEETARILREAYMNFSDAVEDENSTIHIMFHRIRIDFENLFIKDNPRFDVYRFINACDWRRPCEPADK